MLLSLLSLTQFLGILPAIPAVPTEGERVGKSPLRIVSSMDLIITEGIELLEASMAIGTKL